MSGEGGRGTALVTGAARRLGRAMALDLGRQGIAVAVHYHRSAVAAKAVVAAIEAAGGRARALAADLADEAETKGLIDALQATDLPPLALLVNNAAVFERDGPASADAASWARHMAINLRAPLVLTQGLLAALPPGQSANVVNLLDQRVLRLTPNFTSYSVSKVGLWGLTQHLALALAPRVRVNAIAPGLALAPDEGDRAAFEAMAEAMPLGHGTDPEEICRTLRYILETPSMTGQMLLLDGGQHLGWLHPGQAGPATT
jgi:NAD(P)-dependent dehydrogenase (short-subunit alcohol dehydrogenase family)